MLGLALLVGLALATFSIADPVFETGPVSNRAGLFGAGAAALLFGTLGIGAVVVVGAVGVFGARLVLGFGIPRLASRFWVGAPILLVTVATLPPWTPMFAVACAVVTETGGVLSHTAITAREYGLPAVLAVAGATRLLKDGQLVEVDGTAGTVTVVG